MKTARDVILTGCSGGLIIHILLLIFDSLVCHAAENLHSVN